jgi:protoporphyrinogen oxidase
MHLTRQARSVKREPMIPRRIAVVGGGISGLAAVDDLGHNQRLARIEAVTCALPGLELAGNAYHGVGIPDCIHSGQEAAERVLSGVRKEKLAA